MSENMSNEISLLSQLTPQEREELLGTLARVLDTMVSH